MIIAIVNNKGGVGKTTTAVHIAYILAQQGKKVLCVDMDGQANLLMHFYQPQDISEMKSQQNGKAPDILHHNSGIDVLALSFWRIESKSYIKSIREAAKRYDVVLIDCPPSLEDRTLAAIEAADTVLIPTEPEAHSLAGLTEIQQIVEAHNKQILGIVITRYNSKKAVHKFFVKEAYQFFPQFMLDTNVPDTTVFPSAAAAGQLGFEYWGNRKQKNVGLQAYTDIANVIVERLV